jgi:hypothetical protein
MADYRELCERLRLLSGAYAEQPNDLWRGADAIESLLSEIERKDEALREARGHCESFIECMRGDDYFDPLAMVPEVEETIAKIDAALSQEQQG